MSVPSPQAGMGLLPYRFLARLACALSPWPRAEPDTKKTLPACQQNEGAHECKDGGTEAAEGLLSSAALSLEYQVSPLQPRVSHNTYTMISVRTQQLKHHTQCLAQRKCSINSYWEFFFFFHILEPQGSSPDFSKQHVDIGWDHPLL